MKACYLDCFSGISGDMFLGALIDAGLDFFELEKTIKGLPLTGYSLTARKVVKQGISATKVQVKITSGETTRGRGLPEITALLQKAQLPEQVKENSLEVFKMLVSAEAKVHGVSIEETHLHEVGGIDAIVDIVGTVLGLYLLGISAVYASPLPTGWGSTTCQHGIIPVPAPATLELLTGMPTVPGPVLDELVTPTGAALVAALARQVGPMPSMEIEAVGYGAGTKDFTHANVMRAIIGKVTEDHPEKLSQDKVAVVEATIDDMNPELFSNLGEILFDSGVLEYFLTPVYMKKNRPGTMVTALCPAGTENLIARLILEETSSLGCRIRHEHRLKADRQLISVTTPYGNIDVKYSLQTGTISPEYDQCKKMAAVSGVTVKAVYDAAKAQAWKALWD